MKNILVAMILGVFVLGNYATQAQESEAQSTTATTSEQEQKDGRISLDIGVSDDELNTDEKYAAAKTAIKATVDEEFAKEREIKLEVLGEEQKADIASMIEQKFRVQSSDGGIGGGEIVVAFSAIVLIFGMPVFILLLVLWFGHKKRKQKLEIINTYLQANQEVPDQVLSAFDSETDSTSLRKGILLTGVGFGIFAGFSVGENMTVAGIGLIPFFMGVARLLYWYVEERHQVKKV